jgi:transposase-like protein
VTTARAVPFYCPYCGDEDLRPHGDAHGAWWCRSCRRAWTLHFLGTGTPGAPGGDDAAASAEPPAEQGQSDTSP